MRDHALVFGMAALMAATLSARAASGQMAHGGGQGHEHAQGAMQAGMTATDKMMGNIDTMMANAGSMMRDLTAMHAGMSGGAHHDQMMSSMQGMLDQMRQFQGSLNDMMKDPAFRHDSDAMKSFQQSGRNLEQMTSAFQSMAKNMTKAMKGIAHDPK